MGVIVLGLDQTEYTHLAQQVGVLQMFARHAGMALSGYRIKKALFKVAQSERLGASHELARKIIYEINNPLGIIKNYLKILDLKLAEQNIGQDEIVIINEEIDRVSQILRDLLAFSNKTSLTPQAVDVNKILSDMVKLTREPLFSDHKITIYTDFDPSLPPVRADRNALKQVFINLIKNAAEALTEGGNIYIKTKKMSPELDAGMKAPGVASTGLAEITISDDGPGISKKIRNRIFQPFASTKGGSHLGLGLSVVHNIIEALDGTITCESEEGKGTSFRISLPLYSTKNT